MTETVYVNGSYVPAEDARVSIFDRGFIFGDGVYEVIPVIAGKPVDRQYFLERLRRSLSELKIDWPCSETEYLQVMHELAERNGIQEGMIYSQVTRGVAPREFPFPRGNTPTFVAFAAPLRLLDNPLASSGIRVVTTPDLRWKRRDIKSINLLGQVLAKQDAVSRQAYEGWMVEDGLVTEGVTSTAYIVVDGTLITRPLSNEILPGIRRRTLLELAASNGIPVLERPFSVAEAVQADEALVSSATTLTLGVIDIDGHTIGTGIPGPVTTRLRAIYSQRLLDEAAG